MPLRIARQNALDFLLRPVRFTGKDSRLHKLNLTEMRIQQVLGAHPFLTGDEQQRADAWLKEAERLKRQLQEFSRGTYVESDD